MVSRYDAVNFPRPWCFADFLGAILHAFLQCMNAHCILCPDWQRTVDHCQSIFLMSRLLCSKERVQLAKFT